MKGKRQSSWYKTYDYQSGHTYILGEKFTGKGAAIAFAKSCGMVVIPQSTVSITDDQRRIAILENQVKELQDEKAEKEAELA